MLTEDKLRMTYGLPSKAEVDQFMDLLAKGKVAPIGEVRTWSGQQYVKHADGWVHVHPTTGKVSVLPTSGPVKKLDGNDEHKAHYKKHLTQKNDQVSDITRHAAKSKDNAVMALKALGKYKKGDENQDHFSLQGHVGRTMQRASQDAISAAHQTLAEAPSKLIKDPQAFETTKDDHFNDIVGHIAKSKDNAITALKALGKYKKGDENQDHFSLRVHVGRIMERASKDAISAAHQTLAEVPSKLIKDPQAFEVKNTK